MRLAFLGTPDFAVPTLAALIEAGHEIACVYSQPPAPRGRGQALQPSPVEAFARAHGLPVRTPHSMRDPDAIAAFAALDLDAAVIVAFGQILVDTVLNAPRLGCYNLHASLLPRWRGAAPIHRAIMAGDAVTGAQVMRMTAGLDEGPVLASVTLRIDALDTVGTLHDRLAPAGAALMAQAMEAVARGEAHPTPQTEEGVTYAKKIRPAEARIRWDRPAARVDCQIRGLSPFPGAWFLAPSNAGRCASKPCCPASRTRRARRAWPSMTPCLSAAARVRCGSCAPSGRGAVRPKRPTSCADSPSRGAPGSPDAPLPSDHRV